MKVRHPPEQIGQYPIPGRRVASLQTGAFGQALQSSGVDQISGLLSAYAAVTKHLQVEPVPVDQVQAVRSIANRVN